MKILPPEIKETWEKNSLEKQAEILAYDQIRAYEESKEFKALLETIAGVPRL